ncbi:N6-adenosine-specific RNA methylase IME4/ParB-like chromosome segregation protein Spo0J [Ensifer sp. WSM1721]|uniref:MT-A70 family methyltransferase n=1 Tax=Ensifer sp. WSM1721 TaxID=1041159 RepID=UPI0004AE2D29|nr:MT-A70 family methyltransferase [Ensifer sp. WSM1721]
MSESEFSAKIGNNDLPVALRISQIHVGHRLRVVDQAKVDALKASIEELGLRTPISVVGSTLAASTPLQMVTLAAGAHRLEAMKQLGREHIAAIIRNEDDLDAELWEIDENLCRAELTPADRALFVFRRKEIYLLKHPDTAHGAVGNGREKSRQVGDSTDEPKRFTAATAEATGQSERAIQRDAERGEKISAKALRMLRGTRHDKGVVLDRLKSLRDEEQEVYVRALFEADKAKEAEAHEIRSDKMATKRAVRIGIINAIAEHGQRVAGEMPRAAYAVGYADPPWEQEAWSDETGQDKGLMYPPMPLEEIKALCAGEKSPFTRDAILFLWVTTNRLDDGISVLKSWGFEFVSAITWDKQHIGMGRWVRDRTEHLLIGKRGDFPGLIMGTQPESLYSEAKGGHSRKPVWFAEQIDRLFPEMRKLELFQRRESLGEGDIRLNGLWDFWGFEAGGDDAEPSAEAPVEQPAEPAAVAQGGDPLAEAIIAAGLAPSAYILNLNRGLTNPATLDLPSRLFRFPVEFMAADRSGGESRLLLRHPLLWQILQVSDFLAEIEQKIGVRPTWEPLDEFGRDFGEQWRWYHSVDLCNDQHWQGLLKTQRFTDRDKIFTAVQLGLESKSLSVKNARSVMAELESIEPARSASVELMLGNVLMPYRHDKGKLISPNISERNEIGAWLVIHGLEDGFFNYAGSYLSVTADGMARREKVENVPAPTTEESAPQAEPASKLPPGPGKKAPVEFHVGGMRKGSFARFAVHLNDDGTHSISAAYDIKDYAGGTSERIGNLSTFAGALRMGLAELAGRLRPILKDESAACTSAHRACARAGLKWIEARFEEWGLGAVAPESEAA